MSERLFSRSQEGVLMIEEGGRPRRATALEAKLEARLTAYERVAEAAREYKAVATGGPAATLAEREERMLRWGRAADELDAALAAVEEPS